MLGDGRTCHPDASEMSSLAATPALTGFRKTSYMAGW